MPKQFKPSYVPHILPEWENQCNILKTESTKSKHIQLTDENAYEHSQTTSGVGWKRRVDYAMKNLQTENEDNDQDSTVLNGLLENCISTVIVLASGGELPDAYLINSYLYLRSVCNEFRNNPPNISHFLELLKTKAPEEVQSILKLIDEDAETKDLPPNLTITQIPKDFQ